MTFIQLSMSPLDLQSTSVNFLCIRGTLCKLPSTFRQSAESSINFCQISVCRSDYLSIFRSSAGSSFNFVNLPCARETFRKLSLTFYASMGTSVKNPYGSIQHSSTVCPSARHSVNSPFVHATFHQLPSTFCLSEENILCGSWTFRLTSDNFLCGCVTFRQLSVRLRYHPSCFSASAGYSVNVSCIRRTFCKPM